MITGEPKAKAQRRRLFFVIAAVAAVGLAGLAGAVVLFIVAPPLLAGSIERAEERACAADLGEIYKELIMYKTSYGGLTPERGLGLLTSSEKGDEALWGDVRSTHASRSDYAWRDLERFPLARFPGDESEPLVACGDDAERRHPGVLHVLYTDARVETLSLDDLKAQGTLNADAERIPVGPDSPVEDLRKLSRD